MKKTHVLNTLSIAFIGLSMFLTSWLFNGLSYAFETVFVKVAAGILIGVFIYYIPVKDRIKAVAYPTLVVLIASYLILTRGNSVEDILMYVTALSMAAVYFDKRIFLSALLIIFTALIGTFFVDPENFLTVRSGMYAVILGGLVLLGATILFYYSVYAGNKALMDSKESEERANQLLNELSSKIETLEDTAKEIQSNVYDITDRMVETKKKSAIVEMSIRDISDSVAVQAGNVEDISHEVSFATDELIKTKELSLSVNAIKDDSAANIKNFSQEFDEMNASMKRIDHALNSANDVVTILNVNMEDVKAALEGINRIATQTNLLALNASIESARAGEMGRGFAVVAEEIRKLSDETAQTVERISTVIHKLFDSTHLAANEVKSGLTSVSEGRMIIVRAGTSLSTVLDGFDAIGTNIQAENAKIQSITDMIERINRRLQDLTAISEEQASASIVISDEMKKQQEEIEGVAGSVERLKMLSHTLDGSHMNVNEEFFLWNNNLSVNIKEIDDQHKQLLNIGKKLQDFSKKSNKTQKEFLSIIQELKDYTVFHFGNEEAMLKRSGYPDFDMHKAVHDKFIKEITGIHYEAIDPNDLAQLDKIMRSVSKWILQHIANTDFKYSEHVIQALYQK